MSPQNHITWQQFIKIIEDHSTIFQESDSIADPNLDDEGVTFHFENHGLVSEICLSEEDNPYLQYEDNVLYFIDSEGDNNQIEVFMKRPYSFV